MKNDFNVNIENEELYVVIAFEDEIRYQPEIDGIFLSEYEAEEYIENKICGDYWKYRIEKRIVSTKHVE